MRIAFLTWRDLEHPDAGGSEVYVQEVAAGLAASGHEVVLVTSRPSGVARRGRLNGVTIERRGGRLGVYLYGFAYVLWHRRRLDVVVDVINGLPFGTPMARGVPTVALIHHVHMTQWRMIYPGWRGRLGWLVESRVTPWLYRSVPHVTVSEASRRDLVRLGLSAERVAVVRNGLHQPEQVRSFPAKSSSPRICVLARLVPHKQIEHVLDSAAALRDRHPGLGVDIVGEGWWHAVLDEHTRRVGVEDLVTFHGHVTEEHRDDLLARAWVMVLPSTKEGWGIAVTEAAAQGTPTVGYRSSGGLGESVVDGDTGWLVEDRSGLIGVLDHLLGRPDELAVAGDRARLRSMTLSWATASADFADILRDAVVAAGVSGRRR